MYGNINIIITWKIYLWRDLILDLQDVEKSQLCDPLS